MSKLLIGILIGIGVALPTTVAADYVVHSRKNMIPIYQTENEDIYVDKFKDGTANCYVAYENRPVDAMPSITCGSNR